MTRKTLSASDPATTNLHYEKIERDFYPTPKWMADVVVANWRQLTGRTVERTKVWEPAAGGHVLVKAYEAAKGSAYSTDIHYNVLNDDTRDFLSYTPAEAEQMDFDWIWTNPPFGDRCKLAVKFIEHALKLTQTRAGGVIMLGRNDFNLASTRRHIFGDHGAYAGKLSHTKRPMWIEDTDGQPRFNYSWFIWNWRKVWDAPNRPPFEIIDYEGGRNE